MQIAKNNKGQFEKGNKGGPGRPKREREEKYLKATFDAVSIEDWQAIVKKAIADAKEGNGYARNWLAAYLIGKPEDTVNVNSDQPVQQIILRFNDVDDNSGHEAE